MFDKNDYETPDNIAQAMAKLILPTDRWILEPFAGTGQIAKALSSVIDKDKDITIVVNEINKERFRKLCQIGKISAKCNDFMFVDSPKSWDLIITNPPFDYAIEGIKKSLTLLNDKPESRLLWLLPIDTFSSRGRAKAFSELDCHISKIHIIPGRIDYLKDGIPMSKCQKEVDGVPQFKNGKPVMCSGRQVSDAVFEIKKGKSNLVDFLEV